MLGLCGKSASYVLLLKDLIGSSGLFLSVCKICLMIVTSNCINVSILLFLSDKRIQLGWPATKLHINRQTSNSCASCQKGVPVPHAKKGAADKNT